MQINKMFYFSIFILTLKAVGVKVMLLNLNEICILQNTGGAISPKVFGRKISATLAHLAIWEQK